MKCLICELDVSIRGFSSHLKSRHNTTNRDYYDSYIKASNEGICPVCGKETTFGSITGGYSKHCSIKCVNRNPETREKIEKTSINRYGVKCNLNVSEVRQKAHSNSQSKEAKDKRINTNIEKYGVANVYASEQVKQKIKANNIEKYGVEYSWQRADVKQKIKDSCFERYNDVNYRNTDKIKNTKNERVLENEKAGYVLASKVFDLFGSGW